MGEIKDFIEGKSSTELKELVSFVCNKLKDYGEEAFFVTVNPSQNKTDYVGSEVACNFLKGRQQILEDFYQYCHEYYVSEAVGHSKNSSKCSSDGIEVSVKKKTKGKISPKKGLKCDETLTEELEINKKQNVQTGGNEKLTLEEKVESKTLEQKPELPRKRGRKPKNKEKNSRADNSFESPKNSRADNSTEYTLRNKKREIKPPKWAQSYMMEENQQKSRKRLRSDDEADYKDHNTYENDTVRRESKKVSASKQGRKVGYFKHEKSFASEENFDSNVRVSQKDNNMQEALENACSKCGTTFPNKTELQHHLHIVHKISEDFKCENCHAEFESAMLFNEHLKLCKFSNNKNPGNDKNINDVVEEKSIKKEQQILETEESKKSESNVMETKESKKSESRWTETKENKNSESDRIEKGSDQEQEVSQNSDNDPEFQLIGSFLNQLICQMCTKTFRTRKYLTQHLKRVHKLIIYLCHCLKSFRSNEELTNHCREAHTISQKKDGYKQENIGNYTDQDDIEMEEKVDAGEKKPKHTALDEKKTVKCELCNVSFTIVKNLKRHMKNIHSEKKNVSVFCEECGKGLEDSWKLKCHLRNDHKFLNVFKCELCPQSFHTPVMFRRHRKDCDGSDTEKVKNQQEMDSRTCRICLKVLLTEKNLEMHLKSHIENPNLVCQICQKTFVNPRRLKDHYEVHKKSLDQKFPCPYCDKAFLLSRYLLRHIQDVHKEKVQVCKTCGAVCQTVEELSVHFLQTHGPGDPNQPKRNINGISLGTSSKFICETCGKTFKQKQALKSHSAVHYSDRPFKCEKCGMTFKSFGTLSVHRRYRHRTFKAYQCELCGKCFKMPETLRCHKRRHDKPKYHCEFCNKNFRSLDGFKYHMLLLHKTDQGISQYKFRVFKCDYCDRMFGHKSNYDYHIKTHTGIKPFKCDHCDKAFPILSKLNLHMRSHTGEKTFTCDICDVTVLTRTKYNKHIRTLKHRQNSQKLAIYQPENNQEKLNIYQAESSHEKQTSYQQENMNNVDEIVTMVTAIESMDTTSDLNTEVKVNSKESFEMTEGSKPCVVDIGQQTESYVISVENLDNASELVESIGQIYQHEQAQVLNQQQNQGFEQGHNLDEVEQIIEISIPYHVLPVASYPQTEQEAVTLESESAVQSIQQ